MALGSYLELNEVCPKIGRNIGEAVGCVVKAICTPIVAIANMIKGDGDQSTKALNIQGEPQAIASNGQQAVGVVEQSQPALPFSNKMQQQQRDRANQPQQYLLS